MAVMAFHFLLRIDEAFRLLQGRVRVERETLKITICGQKTERKGVWVDREQGCGCVHDRGLCPLHTMEAFLQSLPSHRKGPEKLVFKGSYREALAELRQMLDEVGVVTVREGLERFGFHSLRRGGTQALARAG